MKTWQDWKIGTKFGVLFGSFLVVLLAAGAMGFTWLGRLNANTTAELRNRFNVTKLTNDTIANSTDNARITMQLFETTDPDEEKKLNEQNDAISHNIGLAVAEIEKSLSSQQERDLFQIVSQNRTNYVTARQRAKKLLMDKKRDQAMAALTGEVIPALTVYRASWVKFIDLQSDAVQRSIKESADAYARGRRLALFVFFLPYFLRAVARSP